MRPPVFKIYVHSKLSVSRAQEPAGAMTKEERMAKIGKAAKAVTINNPIARIFGGPFNEDVVANSYPAYFMGL